MSTPQPRTEKETVETAKSDLHGFFMFTKQ